MKKYMICPYQSAVSVFRGKKELAFIRYTSEEEKNAIVRTLQCMGVRLHNAGL